MGGQGRSKQEKRAQKKGKFKKLLINTYKAVKDLSFGRRKKGWYHNSHSEARERKYLIEKIRKFHLSIGVMLSKQIYRNWTEKSEEKNIKKAYAHPVKWNKQSWNVKKQYNNGNKKCWGWGLENAKQMKLKCGKHSAQQIFLCKVRKKKIRFQIQASTVERYTT